MRGLCIWVCLHLKQIDIQSEAFAQFFSHATGYQLPLLGGLGMNCPISREDAEEGPGLTEESWLASRFSTLPIRGSLRDGGLGDCSILNTLWSHPNRNPNLYSSVFSCQYPNTF